jgi:hypothetical protein
MPSSPACLVHAPLSSVSAPPTRSALRHGGDSAPLTACDARGRRPSNAGTCCPTRMTCVALRGTAHACGCLSRRNAHWGGLPGGPHCGQAPLQGAAQPVICGQDTVECLPKAQARVTVQPDPLLGRACVEGAAAVRDRHPRRPRRGTVWLDHGAHTWAFLLGSPTCLVHQGLCAARDRQSGDRGVLLLQRVHGPEVSSCHRAARHAAGAHGARSAA